MMYLIRCDGDDSDGNTVDDLIVDIVSNTSMETKTAIVIDGDGINGASDKVVYDNGK